MPIHQTAGIITVTLNPAVDETVFLDDLRPGSVNRASRHHRQAGGKGVNVSAMLACHGIPTTATGFLGGDNPRLFENLFHETGIRDAFIRTAGETRSSIKIIAESTRQTTDINLPGAPPAAADLDLLIARIRALAKPGAWFVIGGSLPVGVSLEFFKQLVTLIKASGAKLAVDTSGPPLQAAIDCGADLIKPNHHELSEILDHSLPDFGSRFEAATRLQNERVPHVILSLGPDGALFLSPDARLIAQPPPALVVSTVGAGDALLAGYLAGLVSGCPAEDRARLAVVFAWSALEDIRRQLPARAEIENRMRRIVVRPLNKA